MINFSHYGNSIKFNLKDGQVEVFNAEWWNINGYIMLLEILMKQFNNISFPNLDIIKDFISANYELMYGKITEEQFNKIFLKIRKINKDFH